MTTASGTGPTEEQRQRDAWRAVAELYHAYFIGIVLFPVSRLGASKAEELVHEVFCRQRRERFLPGLKKLGIDHLPPAVAAAQYHYLSNHIGGVAVEYMPESDRKAWFVMHRRAGPGRARRCVAFRRVCRRPCCRVGMHRMV